MGARDELRQLGAHALAREPPACERLHQVACFAQRAGIGIDENLGARNQLIVGFAHLRRKAADQIHVHPGTQQAAAHDRFGSGGGTADDVRLRQSLRQIGERACRQALLAQQRRQRLRPRRIAAPQHQLCDRPQRAMRARHVRRKRAASNDQQRGAILARKISRCEGRCGGSAAQRERLAVDQRARMSTRAVEQHVQRRHRGRAAFAVVREHRHQFDPQILARAPGRHQQQPVAGAGDVVHMAQGRHAAFAKCLAQRFGKQFVVERGVDLRG